jgi:hypothetical protein
VRSSELLIPHFDSDTSVHCLPPPPFHDEIIMKTALTYLSLFALTIAFVGCKTSTDDSSDSSADSGAATAAPVIMDEMPPMLEDAHGHPEHGPHGGELVELGKEDFHAEFVHGEGGISIYVLDGSATKLVAIPSEKLVVSLKHDGQVASFDLAANPEASDAASQTARFTSTDAKFDEWLDAGAKGAVVIQIEGKSYTGKIAHDHDHLGHNH